MKKNLVVIFVFLIVTSHNVCYSQVLESTISDGVSLPVFNYSGNLFIDEPSGNLYFKQGHEDKLGIVNLIDNKIVGSLPLRVSYKGIIEPGSNRLYSYYVKSYGKSKGRPVFFSTDLNARLILSKIELPFISFSEGPDIDFDIDFTQKKLFLTKAVTKELFVIDLAKKKITKTIDLSNYFDSDNIYNVAVNKKTNKVYIASSKFNKWIVVNGITDTVESSFIPKIEGIYSSFKSEGVSNIAINENLNKIYFSRWNRLSKNAELYVIDGKDHSAIAIFNESYIEKIAVNNNSNLIYLIEAPVTIKVIDGNTNTLKETLSVGIDINDVVIDQKQGKVYISDAIFIPQTIFVISENGLNNLKFNVLENIINGVIKFLPNFKGKLDEKSNALLSDVEFRANFISGLLRNANCGTDSSIDISNQCKSIGSIFKSLADEAFAVYKSENCQGENKIKSEKCNLIGKAVLSFSYYDLAFHRLSLKSDENLCGK